MKCSLRNGEFIKSFNAIAGAIALVLSVAMGSAVAGEPVFTYLVGGGQGFTAPNGLFVRYGGGRLSPSGETVYRWHYRYVKTVHPYMPVIPCNEANFGNPWYPDLDSPNSCDVLVGPPWVALAPEGWVATFPFDAHPNEWELKYGMFEEMMGNDGVQVNNGITNPLHFVTKQLPWSLPAGSTIPCNTQFFGHDPWWGTLKACFLHKK